MDNAKLQEKLIEKKRFSKIFAIIVVCVLTTFAGFLCGLKIGTPENDYSHVTKVLNILENEWYSEIYYDSYKDAPIAQFISSVANLDSKKQLDPYTYIIKRQQTTSNPNSGKLGIRYTNLLNTNYQLILSVYPNSAADNAGVQMYDIVYGVKLEDGSFVTSDFEQYLSKNIGETLTLLIARIDYQSNLTSYLEIPVTYQKYSYPSAYTYKSFDDKLLYIKLTGFESDITGSNTIDEFRNILSTNKDKKYLVIDLINNGGGSIDSLTKICDLFLPAKKTISTLEIKDKSKTVSKTHDSTAYKFDDIYILMNENTASASEMLIGCLDYHLDNVHIIGTNTFGKGIAQRTINLTKDYDFQYTFAKWYTPANEWIHTKGFTPSTSLDAISYTDNYKTFRGMSFDTLLDLSYDSVDVKNVKNIQVLLNDLYSLSLREDGYFDMSTKIAIEKIQQENNITVDGKINEQTLLLFAIEYAKEYYGVYNQYISRIKSLMAGE